MSALRLHVSCLAHSFCAGCFPCWFMGIRRISPVLWRGRTPCGKRPSCVLHFRYVCGLPAGLHVCPLAHGQHRKNAWAYLRQRRLCSAHENARDPRGPWCGVSGLQMAAKRGTSLGKAEGSGTLALVLAAVVAFNPAMAFISGGWGRSTRCLRFFWSLWSRCS